MQRLDPEDFLGRAVGPYTVDRFIGQGGFAWVFAAHRTTGGDPVALKILKPRYAGDTQFESRFRNESEIASELKHPSIVPILEVGHTGDLTYFAMDLYADSLASRIEREGPLPEDALVAIAIDIADALAFAHRAGIIHRDIKIDNILLRADGHAVLSDFGIARAVSGYVSATGVNMTIGTPHYLSPEQAQGRPLDGRTDLYALGVTLYRASTGHLPFRSTDWFELARMHVEEAPESPRARRPEISRRFERVILRCLAKHPDDRYASAEDLLEELRQLQAPSRPTESFGTAPRGTLFGRRDARPERSRPGWIRVAVALVVIGTVALLVVLFGKR